MAQFASARNDQNMCRIRRPDESLGVVQRALVALDAEKTHLESVGLLGGSVVTARLGEGRAASDVRHGGRGGILQESEALEVSGGLDRGLDSGHGESVRFQLRGGGVRVKCRKEEMELAQNDVWRTSLRVIMCTFSSLS